MNTTPAHRVALSGVAVVAIAFACAVDAPKEPAKTAAAAPPAAPVAAAPVAAESVRLVSIAAPTPPSPPGYVVDRHVDTVRTPSKAPPPPPPPPRQVEPGVYYEFQVEAVAELIGGTGMPAYPPALRNAGVEGEVLATFVVDDLGVPDESSLKILKSTHESFSDAVRSALPLMRFRPARVGGRTVRQLVQLPFKFSIK